MWTRIRANIHLTIAILFASLASLIGVKRISLPPGGHPLLWFHMHPDHCRSERYTIADLHSIPFREGFYSRTADFSCSFHFSMEYEDANGHAVEYAPYYNHNGWISSSNQTAHLRRNGHFTVTFVTGLNHS